MSNFIGVTQRFQNGTTKEVFINLDNVERFTHTASEMVEVSFTSSHSITIVKIDPKVLA